MIATLHGVIQAVGDNQLVLELGGIGLRVAVPLSRLESMPRLGDRIFLHTYLVVREDSLELFGFGEAETRRLFELLMGVSGVGPRLALATVSHLPGDAIRRAVGGQPELLTRVPGVGRKTAEKIAFELKDKLGEPGLPIEPPSELDGEVLGVLTSLGYSLVEGQAAVQSLAEDAPEELEARVRLALRYFAKP